MTNNLEGKTTLQIVKEALGIKKGESMPYVNLTLSNIEWITKEDAQKELKAITLLHEICYNDSQILQGKVMGYQQRLERIRQLTKEFPKSNFQTMGNVAMSTTWKGTEVQDWLERLKAEATQE